VTDTAGVNSELAALLSRAAACRLWAEQDEGSYHRDAQPERRDVVEDRQGAHLQLGIRLMGDDGEAMGGAAVEIWQCDALGHYSGFPPPDDSTVVTAGSVPRGAYLADQTFLRGLQVTDRAGMVEFRTIYPGWYPGRTVHIHLMVRARGLIFTSQLYFPDALTDRVHVVPPYAQRPGRDTTNDSDEIFPTGGAPALVDIQPVGDGYRAAICLAPTGQSGAPPWNGR
jgi:protocatechuate 3,4-dioxygenase beta subunit